jgi:hypothetical protein
VPACGADDRYVALSLAGYPDSTRRSPHSGAGPERLRAIFRYARSAGRFEWLCPWRSTIA